MTDQLAGSLLTIGALVVFVVIAARHGMAERRKERER